MGGPLGKNGGAENGGAKDAEETATEPEMEANGEDPKAVETESGEKTTSEPVGSIWEWLGSRKAM